MRVMLSSDLKMSSLVTMQHDTGFAIHLDFGSYKKTVWLKTPTRLSGRHKAEQVGKARKRESKEGADFCFSSKLF